MGKGEERYPHVKNLADEQLKELQNPSLNENERVLLRCEVAADLIHRGQYEGAREALGELWLGIGQRPPATDLPPTIEAEALLQCGTLTGWLGSVRNVSGAQEQAKDMLSEAERKFRAQGIPAKVSETQYELAACYWRLGQYDEARVVLQEALKRLTDSDAELKAKILIRRTNIEVWDNKCHDALYILKEAEPVFESANDALKGRWHGQKGLVLRRLAAAEGQPDYYDRAIIEYTAAIYHYELAKHERYCGNNLNNLAFLLYKLGRYREAHEHLDRAQMIFTKLKDSGSLAQVDETRARVLVAEKRYRDAERLIISAVKVFEQGGESALLADALVVQGVVWARLGVHESGALTQAGHAALTLIEEHGTNWWLLQEDLITVFSRASNLLKGSQNIEDKERLLACAQVVIKRLSGMQIHDRNFTFYGAVEELEAKLIKQALELEGGNVSRAAERLGLKRQTLANMLRDRHSKLYEKRTPPVPRLKSIIKEPKE
jgi:tetratricopeptide (TPR) repeat protein